MKLLEGFSGYVIAKVIDYDVPYYKYEIYQAFKEADRIKFKAYIASDGDNIPICSGGLKYAYLWNDDITIKYLIYNDEYDIYESMDMNVENCYYIKILKITE